MFEYESIVEELRLLDEVMYPHIEIRYDEISFCMNIDDYNLCITFNKNDEKYMIQSESVDSAYLKDVLKIIERGYINNEI